MKISTSQISWLPGILEMYICSLLILSCLFIVEGADPVNVALNKPIEAQITCGMYGPEQYYNHSQITSSNGNGYIASTCVDTTTHPATAMVDGDPNTWWQSTNRSMLMAQGFISPQATITIDLLQVNYHSLNCECERNEEAIVSFMKVDP